MQISTKIVRFPPNIWEKLPSRVRLHPVYKDNFLMITMDLHRTKYENLG